MARITDLAGDGEFKFMEVCGGHTHTIYRHGIEHLLPPSVELVHGPGCPVCVIPMGRVDDAISVATQPRVIFTSFGDMMRVPGSKGNLLKAKAEGADVRFVYSPLDALRIAVENPDRQVVFFAVGFETTAPSTALTLLQARAREMTNFSVFSNHVTIVPPIKAILESPDLRLDGFLGPGHVSTVIGQRPYRFVPAQYRKPLVTAGFEPLDILHAIAMLLAQITEGRCEVENQYFAASSARKGIRELSRCSKRYSSFGLTSSGEDSASYLRVLSNYELSSKVSTPRCDTRSPVFVWPTRRRANVARCSRASSSPGNARCSAPRVLPKLPSARAWFLPKEPAPPITTSVACIAKPR